MEKYIFYFDSGTTNSRGYLMAADGTLLGSKKCAVGSKDSTIAGDNSVLIDALYTLYTELLRDNGLSDADIGQIYASGMVTCPYGLCDVPHVCVPVTVESFAKQIYPFFEDKRFHREIRLVRGLKTVGDSAKEINIVRGEEIEVIGVMPELSRRFGDREVAAILPGSHTHTLLVKDGAIRDLLSNFTGELYCAIGKDTILSPVLNAKVDQYDAASIRQGVNNLRKYGFTRALYICRAMQVFNEGTETTRASYAEGVILGGLCQALDCFREEKWPGLQDLVIVADAKSADVYSKLLENCRHDFRIHTLISDRQRIPALDGIRVLMRSVQ